MTCVCVFVWICDVLCSRTNNAFDDARVSGGCGLATWLTDWLHDVTGCTVTTGLASVWELCGWLAGWLCGGRTDGLVERV